MKAKSALEDALRRYEDKPSEVRVLRVSEVNRRARLLIEQSMGALWIEGELSDVTVAISGHVYFTLNDERETAQLRGVMFRSDARQCRIRLASGMRVRMLGNLSLYEPRGSFQFIAKAAIEAGAGDAAARFAKLREKLEAEGLLAPERKRPLPRLPRTIGIVTSVAGAALHDILRVTAGRCPVRLVVADCRVQGDGSAESIRSAIASIQQLPDLDLVIIARGGGAAEDLWAFNDEELARAIADCRVPTVAGIGHEVDVTIADLVADVRAATPSNAAEVAVPELQVLRNEIDTLERRLERSFETQVGRGRLRLERFAARLKDPRVQNGQWRKRLDLQVQRALTTLRRRIAGERTRLESLQKRLAQHDVMQTMREDRQHLMRLTRRLQTSAPPLVLVRRSRLSSLSQQLEVAARRHIDQRRARFGELGAGLEALSPLGVLARGYAIVLDPKNGKALRSAEESQVGARLSVRLSRGTLDVQVEKIEADTLDKVR